MDEQDLNTDMETIIEKIVIPNRDERIKAFAGMVQNYMPLLGLFDYEIGIEVVNVMRREVGNYEAIGILDGAAYFGKLKDRKARLARLEALLNLIKVSKETEKNILK